MMSDKMIRFPSEKDIWIIILIIAAIGLVVGLPIGVSIGWFIWG